MGNYSCSKYNVVHKHNVFKYRPIKKKKIKTTKLRNGRNSKLTISTQDVPWNVLPSPLKPAHDICFSHQLLGRTTIHQEFLTQFCYPDLDGAGVQELCAALRKSWMHSLDVWYVPFPKNSNRIINRTLSNMYIKCGN